MIKLITHLCGLLITLLAMCTLNYKSAAEKEAELQDIAWPSGKGSRFEIWRFKVQVPL